MSLGDLQQKHAQTAFENQHSGFQHEATTQPKASAQPHQTLILIMILIYVALGVYEYYENFVMLGFPDGHLSPIERVQLKVFVYFALCYLTLILMLFSAFSSQLVKQFNRFSFPIYSLLIPLPALLLLTWHSILLIFQWSLSSQ